MEKSNFALRLLPSLHKAAQRIAERENCSVNQLINLALAEKIAVLDADYWDERKKAAAKQHTMEWRVNKREFEEVLAFGKRHAKKRGLNRAT